MLQSHQQAQKRNRITAAKKNVTARFLCKTSLRAYTHENGLSLACERAISPVENGGNEHGEREVREKLKAQIAVAKLVNGLLGNFRRAPNEYSCSEVFYELCKTRRGP